MGSNPSTPTIKGEDMKTLSDKWIKVLTSTPETGMGYHVVKIKTKDGRVFITTVINCEELMDELPINEDDIKDITLTVTGR